MAPVNPGPEVEFLVLAILSLAWVGPVGLFVLRKHLVNATGCRRVAKVGLIGLTVLSAPVVLLLVLILYYGATESVDTLWSLFRRAW